MTIPLIQWTTASPVTVEGWGRDTYRSSFRVGQDGVVSVEATPSGTVIRHESGGVIVARDGYGIGQDEALRRVPMPEHMQRALEDSLSRSPTQPLRAGDYEFRQPDDGDASPFELSRVSMADLGYSPPPQSLPPKRKRGRPRKNPTPETES